jgi:hypothetical protein
MCNIRQIVWVPILVILQCPISCVLFYDDGQWGTARPTTPDRRSPTGPTKMENHYSPQRTKSKSAMEGCDRTIHGCQGNAHVHPLASEWGHIVRGDVSIGRVRGRLKLDNGGKKRLCHGWGGITRINNHKGGPVTFQTTCRHLNGY